MRDQGILLESGTNEVEILEFLLRDQSFGVNVAKIQAIEQFSWKSVTVVPMIPASMVGAFLFRNRTIPLIDLAAEFGLDVKISREADGGREDLGSRIVLVMEFNNMTTAFLADGVNRIHRLYWKDIQPLSSVLDSEEVTFTGSVHIEDREILIADMEKIVSNLIPDSFWRLSSPSQEERDTQADRSSVRVVLAEDSVVVRNLLSNLLSTEGYSNLTVWDNGRVAFDYLQAQPDPPDVLITDIEMPAMDGLTLCREVKQDPKLNRLPVVIFSSLINEQMAAKCRSVGANAYISKPQFGKLARILDELCLGQTTQV